MVDFREITFAGRNLRTFGLVVKKGADFVSFADDNVDIKDISGSLIGGYISGDRSRKNVEKTYELKTLPYEITYPENKYVKLLTDWINEVRGYYMTFQDSAKAGYQTYAVLKSVNGFKKSYDGCFEISLTFSMRPYWHKISGLEWIEKTFTNGTEIELVNPENFIAYPTITVESSVTGTNGGFTLIVNGTPFVVSSSDGYVEIDSERQKVYPSQNAAADSYPFFEPGENTIRFQGHSSTTYDLSIQPRWRVY